MRVRIVTGDEFVDGLASQAGGEGTREGAFDVEAAPGERLYELQVTLGNTTRGKARKVSYAAIFTSEGEVSF